MKGLLLDASVTGNWFLDEEFAPAARQAFKLLEESVPIFVPALWVTEVASLLFNAERRKRISKQYRQEALDRAGKLRVHILAPPSLPDFKILAEYAEKHQLTGYDAEYLRVAKLERLTLATLDGNLVAAARREKVAVLAA